MSANLWDCTTGGGGVSTNGSCYNTNIDASLIVTGLGINCGIGVACLLGFLLWRGRFRIYFNRMCLPEVPPALRPPAMKLGGHHQLWSWLVPVFTVPDGKLIESAGLDALIAQRIIGFGCRLFFPLTIVGVAVLMPVNYTSWEAPSGSSNTTATSYINEEFLKMTMSGIPHGSKVLWVHFFFTYAIIAWVCFLIIAYYREFISLRQAHDERLVRSAQTDERSALLDEERQDDGDEQIMSIVRRTMSTAVRKDGLGSLMSMPAMKGFGAATPRSRQYPVGLNSFLASELRSDVHGGNGGDDGAPSNATGKVVGAVQLRQQWQNIWEQLGTDKRAEQHGLSKPPCDANLQIRAAVDRWQRTAAAGPAAGRLAGIAEGDGDGGSSRKTISAHAPSRGAPPRGVDIDDALLEYDIRSLGSEAKQAGSGPQQSGGGGKGKFKLQGRGSSSMGTSSSPGGPPWDELALPFAVIQTADAAQFYTVLVVDEPEEDFSYRHEERPWIWKLPQKLKETPQTSLRALEGFFEQSKAVAGLRSKKKLEALALCERRMEVAEETYQEVFGDDFDRIVPIYGPKPADKLLSRWWVQRGRLDRLRLERQKLEEQKQQLLELPLPPPTPTQQGDEEAPSPQGDKEAPQGDEKAPSPEGDKEAPDEPAAPAGGKGGAAVQALRRLRCGSGKASAAVVAFQTWRFGSPTTEEGRHKRLGHLEVLVEKKAGQIISTELRMADLQGQFEQAQVAAAESLPSPCFFATFRSAQAAAYAAQLNLDPLHERIMRALPAPAPNNVNYTTLMRGWLARGTRPIVVFAFVLAMLLFPIGMFAGICGIIVTSVCDGTPANESSPALISDTWFCSDSSTASFLRRVISSLLPSILLSTWQALILPIWLYVCAQAEGRHYSFTSLDLRCAHWFFLHDLLNVFIGGMLGGSILFSLGEIINEPGQFFTILGQAVPASSNFFINYISFRGLAMAPFRLFFPHAVVFFDILKWLRIMPRPQTERDQAVPPISCRYSREIGVLEMTVFVVALGYAVVSPIILPFALAYFLISWPVWRYQMLYVFQSHYSSGGQFWVYTAHRLVICLGVMSSFTAAVMAVKGGYVAALILLFSSIGGLVWFDRYLSFRYDAVVDKLPAVGILAAPNARVDNLLYVPPPMRHRGVGWNPEWGKAWTAWGVPRYGL